MDPAWRQHLEALKHFNEWEDTQLRGLRDSYPEALAWMADAWDLARRTSPDWCSPESLDEHARHLVSVQRALGRAGLSP